MIEKITKTHLPHTLRLIHVHRRACRKCAAKVTEKSVIHKLFHTYFMPASIISSHRSHPIVRRKDIYRKAILLI